jgi:hypothetical protein
MEITGSKYSTNLILFDVSLRIILRTPPTNLPHCSAALRSQTRHAQRLHTAHTHTHTAKPCERATVTSSSGW